MFPQCSLPAAFCSSWLQVSFKIVKTTFLLKGTWVVLTPIFLLWWWVQLGLIYDFYSCFGVMVFFCDIPSLLSYIYSVSLSALFWNGVRFCCKHGKLNKWKDLSREKREETLPRAHTSLSRREQTSFAWVSDAGREDLHSIFEIISLFRVTGMKSFILWTEDAPLGIFFLKNMTYSRHNAGG